MANNFKVIDICNATIPTMDGMNDALMTLLDEVQALRKRLEYVATHYPEAIRDAEANIKGKERMGV